MRLMDFSNDDKHRATLDVLRETLAYLERLPPVPITKEFCARLRAHLDEPTQRLISKGQRELYGALWTPVGLPVLRASVVGDILTIDVPPTIKGDARKAAVAELTERLSSGPTTIGLDGSRNSYPD